MKYKSILKTLFIVAALAIMGYYFQKNWAAMEF
jgi:hypothetical protein